MEEENTSKTRTESSTFGSLFSSLTDEVTTLVRNEVQLAQAEMTEKASQATKGVASIAAAGAVMFSGFLVLLAAAVYGLDRVLPDTTTPWLSALIVGAIVLIIGVILVQAGRKKLQALHLTPDRTMASFRNDKEFAKQHEEQAKEQTK